MHADACRPPCKWALRSQADEHRATAREWLSLSGGRDRDGLLLAALLAVLALLTAPAVLHREQTLAVGESAPFCGPGETPEFSFGFLALSELLGERMGRPLECEHSELGASNVLQKTTSGLAVYHWCTNTPTFSTGFEHWALTSQGLMHWTGPNSDPPLALPLVNSPELRRPCPAAR
jgi:hypothetical protein